MSDAPAPRLLLLPGLGADARLFADLEGRVEFEVPEWPTPMAGETLRAFAARWAPQLAAADDARPLVIGGMSFGGQLALELARRLRPGAVVLLSSHRYGRELTPRFQRQVRSLRWLPDGVVRWGMKRIAMPAIARRERLSAEQRDRLRAMAADTDLSFFRWASVAAAGWTWSEADDRDVGAVHRVHGERDSVIPLGDSGEGAEVLADAGHLIPMSHPDLVSAWLQRVLDAVGRS